jgi:hypothetical protein
VEQEYGWMGALCSREPCGTGWIPRGVEVGLSETILFWMDALLILFVIGVVRNTPVLSVGVFVWMDVGVLAQADATEGCRNVLDGCWLSELDEPNVCT